MLRLSEIADIQLGVSVSLVSQGDISVPIIKIGNLVNGRILGPIDKIVLSNEHIKRYGAITKDVLLANRGTIFKSAVVHNENSSAVVSSNLFRIRITRPDLLLPETLHAFLQSKSGIEQLRAISRAGTTRLTLSAADLGKILIPEIPMMLQEQFARMIRSAQKVYELEHALLAARAEITTKVLEEIFSKYQ
jgi:type I restriction enzyme M protein